MWSDHTRLREADVTAHQAVLRHIEGELAAGRVRIGERLPAERALSGELGVSRPSVREAMRVLEAMGVVRRAVGSGPEAGAVVIAEPSAAVASMLRLHLATSHLPITDIVQTRVLLESWSVRTAAGRADDEDLGAAGRLLDAMDDADLAPDAFHRLDAEFHVTLSTMAGNVLVATVMSALRDAIHDYVMAAVPSLPDWPATARGLRAEHRGVLEAIRNGDGELAATRVVEHIEGFYRATFAPTGVSRKARTSPSAVP
jgi:GntR family transcriptional regulator, transcriptional repressor for pyruvate dehydrogenase complex